MKKKLLVIVTVLIIVIGLVFSMYKILVNKNKSVKGENISKTEKEIVSNEKNLSEAENIESENVKIEKIENVEENKEKEEIEENTSLRKYKNIAIFGIDSGENVNGNTRSDCIIIASINNENNEVKITSIYRDSYVYIDGHGYDKITHAYAYGGEELALKTINDNLDLDITEYAVINFDSFIDIIDIVGGVEIQVDSSELDAINKIINAYNSQNGTNIVNITQAGYQVLNGGQSLAYARIRSTAGGDFKRTERMRIVLQGVFKKVKNLNISQLNQLVDVLLPKVKTNLSAIDILALIPNVKSYNIIESKGWPYETQFYNNGISYVVPVTLEDNVKELHIELFNEDDYVVSSKVKKYSDDIATKTGIK